MLLIFFLGGDNLQLDQPVNAEGSGCQHEHDQKSAAQKFRDLTQYLFHFVLSCA